MAAPASFMWLLGGRCLHDCPLPTAGLRAGHLTVVLGRIEVSQRGRDRTVRAKGPLFIAGNPHGATRTTRAGIGSGQRPVVLRPLREDVELEVVDNRLVISSPDRPRAGWEAAFRAMAAAGDDPLVDAPTPTTFDRSEWEWR